MRTAVRAENEKGQNRLKTHQEGEQGCLEATESEQTWQ